MTNLDRRSRRTKKQLREALIKLLLTHDYATLTVETITEEADLGRTTFYLHYNDKSHLLAATLSDLEDDLARTIISLSKRTERVSPEVLTLFFAEVGKHRDLYRVLLRENTGGQALHRVRRDIRRFILDILETQPPAGAQAAGETKTLVASYVTGALLSTVDWWLERNLEPSADVLGAQFYTMTMSGHDGLIELGARGLTAVPERRRG